MKYVIAFVFELEYMREQNRVRMRDYVQKIRLPEVNRFVDLDVLLDIPNISISFLDDMDNVLYQ